MRTILPPNEIDIQNNEFSVFLAGSIELDLAERWQDTVINDLTSCDNLVIVNYLSIN